MPPFLLTALGFAKTVFGGVPWWVWPIVGLGLLAGLQTIRLEHAKASYATEHANFAEYQKRIAQQAAIDNQKAIEALRTWQAMTEAAQAARIDRLQRENAELQTTLSEIRNAPAEKDGPVAVVACEYFSRLWGQQACPAAGGN